MFDRFLVIILLSQIYALPAYSVTLANSFQLPLLSYPLDDSCRQWEWYGDYDGDGHNEYHLADDACASAGTDVVAIANGIVKFADAYSSCPNWGYLIVIEHTFQDGSQISSIYGHTAPVSNLIVGEEVVKGAHIGDIASMSCWADHIHFGVYDGPYSEIECIEPGNCYTAGYGSSTGNYINPVDYIFDFILTDRERSVLSYLNPFSGQSEGQTVLEKLGSRDGDPYIWFGVTPIAYDGEGIPDDAFTQDYSGSTDEEAIIIHPDTGLAVEIYDDSDFPFFSVWSEGTVVDNGSNLTISLEDTTLDGTDTCGRIWASSDGPDSDFGLPITGPYYVEAEAVWRQDFQSAYMEWDGSSLTFNCYPYSAPGWHEGIGWNGSASAAVVQAYERNGAAEIVGHAFSDNYGGVFVHPWGNIYLQNFENGEIDAGSAIIFNDNTLGNSEANPASLVRDGFWEYYYSNNGQTDLGAPLGDEMDTVTVAGALIGYDPACDGITVDGKVDADERTSCIEEYCGTGYESMQRFETGTLCYNESWWSFFSDGGEVTIASVDSGDDESAGGADTGGTTETVGCEVGAETLTYCTESDGYDDCVEYSNDVCSVKLNFAWLYGVNDIQWGEVEDESDAYIIGEYRVGWTALDANVIYYDVSNPDSDCGLEGCSTGTAYSSQNSITVVTAPGTASYENTLAYRVLDSGDCSFYCYAYFNEHTPQLNGDSIYVLRCYDADDCNAAEHCNKSGSWETWACEALEADGEACTADEECMSGHCYEVTTGVCYTPTATTDADTDGLSDEEETSLGSDLNNSDTDYDGLGDYLEVLAQRSDPTLADTDGDGVSDHSDLCPETTDFGTVDTNGCAVDQMRIMFTLTAHDQNELGPDGGDADGNFGGTVSLDGDVAVVGASEADGGGGRPGAVYVFRWDGTQWNEESKLTASDDGGSYTQFGKALAVSDDVIVVGDYGDNVQNLGSGAVDSILDTSGGAAYVYRWDGTNWNEEAKLAPSDPGYYGFGYSVAVSGDVIVVSSVDYELLDCSPSAYVYRWNGTEWQEEDQIILPDAQDYSSYAPNSPVAVKDDTFVIGALYADSSDATDSGAVYVYRWDGDHWGLESTLTPPSPESDGRFGISVDVDRDMVIAAASGSEKVFIHNGPLGNWVQVGTLGILSYSVSLSGDLAFIGDQSGSSSIAYRWFGSWIEVTQLSQDDNTTAGGDIDGGRLALRGDSALFIYHNILNPTLDTDRDGVSDADEEAEGSDPNDSSSTACAPPTSGTDWTVTRDCTFFSSKTWSGDLYVQNGAVVTIPNGLSLDMDFSQKKLVVEQGSGVLIQNGGSLH